MDFFKAQLDRIQKQLGGLSPSQKMLTVALVAIMVMTLVWWGRYAGEPEMEPLFTRAVAPEDAERMINVLESHGIHPTTVNDKLCVPADKKLAAYAALAYAKALPRGGKNSIDDILKGMNPLQPESTNDKLWNHAQDDSLGQLISRFPEVADAQVTRDPQHELRIGGNLDPVASIYIQMNDGAKATQEMVDAAADLVEGSLAGLKRANIKVVVDKKSWTPRETESGDVSMSEAGAYVQAEELRLAKKIKEHFLNIPGIIPSVTVRINNSSIEQTQTSYDNKDSVSKESEVHNRSSDTPLQASGPTEAGTVSNLGLNAGGTSSQAPAASSTTEENDTKFAVGLGNKQVHTKTPAGETTPVAAAVRVPLDFFQAAFKKEHSDIKEVTNAILDAYVQKEIPRMRTDVMNCLGMKSAENISVQYYVDLTPAAAAPVVASALSVAMLTPHRIKEIAVGALALVSLFMVSTLVKRGAPMPAVALVSDESSQPDADVMEAGEVLLGQVGANDPSMVGVEMNDEDIRTQQVMNQVSSLVKENPDSAAALVKRWLIRA